LEVDAWSGADRCQQQQQQSLRLRHSDSVSSSREFGFEATEHKAAAAAAAAADSHGSSKQYDDDAPCCPAPNVNHASLDVRLRLSSVWTAAGYIHFDGKYNILKDPLMEWQQAAAAAAAASGLQASSSTALPAAHLQETWPQQMQTAVWINDWEPAIAMLSALIKMSDHPAAAAIGCLPAAIKGCEDIMYAIKKKRINLYQETERRITVGISHLKPLPDATLKAESKR
jgi:hypothetical protein